MNYKLPHIIIALLLGILVNFSFTLFFPTSELKIGQEVYSTQTIGATLGIAVLMAYFWITEAISLYITGMLPLVLFPLFKIMPISNIAPLYMKDIIFLFIGGFMMAYAVERWNLHKRIAYKIILLVGNTPSKIMIGIMLTGYLLSMWILNTAVATLLLPAVLAIIGEINLKNNKTKIGTPLLLALAYSCSIGGMATLIGTLPNLCTMEFYNSSFDQPNLNFANWFAMGFPISLVLLVSCYYVLKLGYKNEFTGESLTLDYCKQQYSNLGKMKWEEKIICWIFGFTILLWFTRKNIDFGTFTFSGWGNLFPTPDYLKESTIALLAALLLMLIPSRNSSSPLLRWEDVAKLPVGIIFLFGGGFALAKGMEISGLSPWIGTNLNSFSGLSSFFLVLVLCCFMIFFTEITSNTASTLIMLPVLLELANVTNMHPAKIFIPVTLAASCAFMLPVATPPNTIVYASNKLPNKEMILSGLKLNLISIFVISILSYFLVDMVMG